MSKNEKSLDVPKILSAKKSDFFFTDKDDFFEADDSWSIQESPLFERKDMLKSRNEHETVPFEVKSIYVP